MQSAPHSHNAQEPWAPLLRVATTTLYHGNPFRVLGLSSRAGPRDIVRRFDELKLSIELGAPAFGWVFAPETPPSGDDLRAAVQTLKDPLARVLHELFWFWPENYPDAVADPALLAWQAGDAEGAFRRWEERALSGQAVALHNLAVFHHFAAIDRELAAGPLDEDATAWWTTAIAQWAALRENEDFWRRVRLRAVQMADARVPGDLDSLVRVSLPEVFCGISAALAIGRAQRSQWHEASLQVRFARRQHTVPERAERVLETAVRQVVQGVDLLVGDTTRQLAGDGSEGLALTARLLEAAADELGALEAVCGSDSDFYRQVCTRVVDAALEGIVAYQRRTLDSCGVLPWLTHLTTLPATPEARRRLEEVADVLHTNAIAEKLAAAGVEGGEGSAAEYEAAYRLLVEEFVPGAGRLDFGAQARADYLTNVRRALRELAHAACQQINRPELAVRALTAAVEISEGEERESLAAERREVLCELERRRAAVSAIADSAVPEPPVPEVRIVPPADEPVAALAAPAAEPEPVAAPGPGQPPGFRMEHDGRVLEIGPERIAFGGVSLRNTDVTALRYGVRVGADGGSPGATYHIGWCTPEEIVELDAGNMLGGDDGERKFSLILEALYAHVVPGLIERMIGWVRAGELVPLGEAILRKEGFVFAGRNFHWSSEEAVPYSQLAHALDAGEFVITRNVAADPAEVERHPLVEVWNAVIAGHVIDALAAPEPLDDAS